MVQFNAAEHPSGTPLLSTSGRQKTPALFQKRRSKIGPRKLLKSLARFLTSLGVRRGGAATFYPPRRGGSEDEIHQLSRFGSGTTPSAPGQGSFATFLSGRSHPS